MRAVQQGSGYTADVIRVPFLVQTFLERLKVAVLFLCELCNKGRV